MEGTIESSGSLESNKNISNDTECICVIWVLSFTKVL